MIETPQRIEPALLEDVSVGISDRIAEISAVAAKLENALARQTAASLADMVRIMNCYYSNLIEGHKTRPKDIERALLADVEGPSGVLGNSPSTIQIEDALKGGEGAATSSRDLLVEAVAHVRVQKSVDTLFAEGRLPAPASADFILWLHREFYRGASLEMRTVNSGNSSSVFVPGEWRSRPEHDVAVGRHVPPSSPRVPDFMNYFARRYHLEPMGKAARIVAMAASHHRFNFIHPFQDGNGRVSRLMSHAIAQAAGIGAHGLWSISRGLARGLASRTEYKSMMNHADMPRQGDLDGRGNLSQRALVTFVSWFLDVCLDQLNFMSGLFEIDKLGRRLFTYVGQSEFLRPETGRLLDEALIRGEVARGDVARITGLPERTARRVLNEAVADGILGSMSSKGPVSLRFPMKAQDILFPRLFSES